MTNRYTTTFAPTTIKPATTLTTIAVTTAPAATTAADTTPTTITAADTVAVTTMPTGTTAQPTQTTVNAAQATTQSPQTTGEQTTLSGGNGGTGGSIDSYVDPTFNCFIPIVRKSYPNIIFLVQSYSPLECFETCNSAFNCYAFQVSRSGGKVCGIYQRVIDQSMLQDSSVTTIYTFDDTSCKKSVLTDTCQMSKWYNSTYKCTSGLIATENIHSEEECKAYCSCGIPNCMAAVVRNLTSSLECYVIMEGSDLSNTQSCSATVKQFTSQDALDAAYGNGTDTTGNGSSVPGSPQNAACWYPPQVNNAYLALYKDEYGMAAVYTCLSGYLFPSGEKVRSLVCNIHNWGNIDPVCIPANCSYPPLTYQPFQELERSCPNNLSAGSDPRYFREGRKVEKSKCTLVKKAPHLVLPPSQCIYGCESPLLIQNTTALYYPENETVEYKCLKGHGFEDGRSRKSVHCFDNGSWPEIESCNALFCDEIPALKKVVLSTKDVIYGTILTLNCETGFMFPLYIITIVFECMELKTQGEIVTAEWNDTFIECTDIKCNNPYRNDTSMTTSSDSGILNKPMYTYKEVIEYVCNNPNYKFDDGTKKRELTCSDGGLWNFNNVHCDASRCDPIPDIPNATPSTKLALRNTNVTFTCNEGYWYTRGVSSMWIVCDGLNWSPALYTKCDVVMCPVGSGGTSPWNTTENYLPYGTNINVVCNLGNYFLGDENENTRIVTCNSYGNWSDDVTCYPIDCGSVKGVDRASIVEENPTTNYNSTVHYNCMPGYWFGRDGYKMAASCDANGHWSVDGVTDNKQWRKCQDITCLTLVTYVAPNVTTIVGSSGNVTCQQGQKFQGISDTVINAFCNSYGKWVPAIPTCKGTQKSISTKVQEAPKADIIAGIAVIIMSIELVCLLLIDLPLIKSTFQYLSKNLSRKKH